MALLSYFTSNRNRGKIWKMNNDVGATKDAKTTDQNKDVKTTDQNKDVIIATDKNKDVVITTNENKDVVIKTDQNKDVVIKTDQNKDVVITTDQNKDVKATDQNKDDKITDQNKDVNKDVKITESPLSAIAQAFEEIADLINQGKNNEVPVDLRLKPFCEACSLVSVLFSCLGIAFKFAEMEYTAKVQNLLEASNTFHTLSSIVDLDLKNNTVKSPGSHTRNLRRVRQGLDLIRELFQNFLSPENITLKKAATTAYQQVCAPYHTWAVRTAVSAGMCTLPTREQLLVNINETDKSAEKEMQRYIKASNEVIKTIDNLYIARGITLDW